MSNNIDIHEDTFNIFLLPSGSACMSFCLSMLYPATERSKYTKLQYILPLIVNGCDVSCVALTGEQWLIIEYLQNSSEKIWASGL